MKRWKVFPYLHRLGYFVGCRWLVVVFRQLLIPWRCIRIGAATPTVTNIPDPRCLTEAKAS
eukprot:946820-Pyramimonas_sp.AAC.1